MTQITIGSFTDEEMEKESYVNELFVVLCNVMEGQQAVAVANCVGTDWGVDSRRKLYPRAAFLLHHRQCFESLRSGSTRPVDRTLPTILGCAPTPTVRPIMSDFSHLQSWLSK